MNSPLLAPVHGTEDVLQIADNIIDCMTQPVILPNDEAVITSEYRYCAVPRSRLDASGSFARS